MTFQAPLNRNNTTPASKDRTAKALKMVLASVTLASLTACATSQPDASLAGDDYWQKIEQADIEVIPGNSLGNPLLESASFSTGQPAARAANITPARKMALRALAESSVRQDNPGNYMVVTGDTLWDISERFLSRPWLWPEIWHVNPQIENPHLIYPGDQISLTYVDGKPRLQLVRASSKGDSPISGFPLDAINQFLIEPEVISSAEMTASPYVISSEDDRLIASAGNHIYVRGDTQGQRYNVFRPGEALVDPDTNEVLGHEAIHVSKASMVKQGDPSKLIITSNKRETLVGDRLLSNSESTPLSFQPRAANIGKSGKIISLVDALSRAGQNQIVVLNLGASDGVQPGDVLSVISDDRRVRDVVSGKKNDWVTIEGDESGVIMIFRTFERVSYALIMKSLRTINIYDRVASAE